MNDLVIEAEGLTRCFGGRCVVDHLDLAIPRGCLVGLLGRNGAGKSTTLRLLLGLLGPSAGRSRLLGVPSLALGPAERRRIGHLAESHPVPAWMRPGDFAAWQSAGQPRWNPAVFAGVLDHFAIPQGARAGRLSRGQRAGLCLAAVLAADPDLLLLDDPALGLDPVARRLLLEALVHLTRREGRTIVFSTHLIGDVERVADRLLVLDGGRCRAWCSLDGFRQGVRRWRLLFAGPPPEHLAEPPGFLNARRETEAVEVTLANGPAEAAAVAALWSARTALPVPLDLEEAFIAFVGERRTTRRFLVGMEGSAA